MVIIIPHTTAPLPPPPATVTASRVIAWNKERPSQHDIEALRVVAIIRLLLPYATFEPRGDGGWTTRPTGFHDNSLGWAYANTLDILDDLVADLALVQPSMLQCAAIDPSSDVAIDAGVANHLPGFCRASHLFFQYALTVARCAELASVRAYYPGAFPHLPPIPAAIIIPHLAILLPQPPTSPSASQIVNWNRGESAPRQLEALRVMIIIWRLLPYANFAPRSGRGGWDSRAPGFKVSNDLGWGYANTLDILDELVIDLATLQPSMLQCAAIDPSSDAEVDPDVAKHLTDFCRPAQLLLQYALAVARSANLSSVQAYNPSFHLPPNTAIVIPHSSIFLPRPPASQSVSQIAYWNRGDSDARWVEGLTVLAIIRLVLPYATFKPRGDGGWNARLASIHSHSIGWAFANTLDTLDELVADLALIQPSMSECAMIDPASNAVVDTDVAHYLRGFSRAAQLVLQYALTVARSASLATVRAYNPAAVLLYSPPQSARPASMNNRHEGPWEFLLEQISDQFPGHPLSVNQLLSAGEAVALVWSTAQAAALDAAHPTPFTRENSTVRTPGACNCGGGQTQGEGDQ